MKNSLCLDPLTPLRVGYWSSDVYGTLAKVFKMKKIILPRGVSRTVLLASAGSHCIMRINQLMEGVKRI